MTLAKYEVAVIHEDGTYQLEPVGVIDLPENFTAHVQEKATRIKQHDPTVTELVFLELKPLVTVTLQRKI